MKRGYALALIRARFDTQPSKTEKIEPTILVMSYNHKSRFWDVGLKF
jgi:hypothetical protein